MCDQIALMEPNISDRSFWLVWLEKLSRPVLTAAANEDLVKLMPVEGGPNLNSQQLATSHLEAFARLICGIAPWLELETGDVESRLRNKFRVLAREGIRYAVDPTSRGYLKIGETRQSLVDAAFLALGILRAPRQLWTALDADVKLKLIEAFRATRSIHPWFNNWILFPAMIETALGLMCGEADIVRIEYALRQHEQWYVGDGTYKDGPTYHCDYYNSFVIHPFLLAIADSLPSSWPNRLEVQKTIYARATRYAEIQERAISPEGTYPVHGRSLAYRFGAFHLLADISLRDKLPPGLSPSQVRCALTAVIRRVMQNEETFDKDGWLRVGIVGQQPDVAESYISTGSLYLCSTVLLPLGLSANAPFWSTPPRPWTSVKVWNGDPIPADKSVGN